MRPKYSDIIKPLYEKENQRVKGRKGFVIINFASARGKYITLCEGDDYLTDPLKLQKQMEFLDGNINYARVYTNYNIYNQPIECLFIKLKRIKNEYSIIPILIFEQIKSLFKNTLP